MTSDQQQAIVQAIYHAIATNLLRELEQIVSDAVNDAATFANEEKMTPEEAAECEQSEISDELSDFCQDFEERALEAYWAVMEMSR